MEEYKEYVKYMPDQILNLLVIFDKVNNKTS